MQRVNIFRSGRRLFKRAIFELALDKLRARKFQAFKARRIKSAMRKVCVGKIQVRARAIAKQTIFKATAAQVQCREILSTKNFPDEFAKSHVPVDGGIRQVNFGRNLQLRRKIFRVTGEQERQLVKCAPKQRIDFNLRDFVVAEKSYRRARRPC